MTKITFRIDDIGASSKYFNQHGKKLFKYKNVSYFCFPLANFWFFKRIRPFKKWAPYKELTSREWVEFLEIFKKYKIVPIVSITACWVEKDSSFIPFPDKFPKQAQVLKQAFLKNKIIIANHGLTHCVVGKHRPNFWSSNKKFYREFWPWLDEKVHKEHILESQKILEDFFERPVKIFVPPGNVWSYKTYRAFKKTNIKTVLANRYMLDSNQKMQEIEFINDEKGFFRLHDRELKLHGEQWLLEKINKLIKDERN